MAAVRGRARRRQIEIICEATDRMAALTGAPVYLLSITGVGDFELKSGGDRDGRFHAVSHGCGAPSCLPSVLKRWKSLRSLTTFALRYIRSGSPFLALSNLKCCNITRRGRKTSNLLDAKSKSTSTTL